MKGNIIEKDSNKNRLEVIEEYTRIRQVVANTSKVIHETREANQVLEETVKIRDMQLKAMETVIEKLREESTKHKKEAEYELEQKNEMIRSLEEELGVWDHDKSKDPTTVREAELGIQNDEWISVEARRQNTPLVKCKECNFKTNDYVRMLGHMTKHKGYQCNKCDKSEKTQGDLNHHIQTMHRPDLHTCDKCHKQFPAKNALKQHMNSQHPTNPPVGHAQWANDKNQMPVLDYCCNQCGSGFEELKQLKDHRRSEHEGQSFNGFKTITEPCRFYLQGRCNRNPCKSRHQQQQPQQQTQPQQQEQQTPRCSRGQSCQFFVRGICHFFHPGAGVQLPRRQNSGGENKRTKKKCHFQEKCWNNQCTFEHEDFSLRRDFQENY